jgi:hypothetical protein
MKRFLLAAVCGALAALSLFPTRGDARQTTLKLIAPLGTYNEITQKKASGDLPH